VRPERRRVVLAGESPDRVSAGAPGSRLQPRGEIHPGEAECRKPLKKRGANQRAATIGERCSLVKLSAERRLGEPSRSCHGEGNRQHSAKPDGMLDLYGVSGGGTLGKSNAEQERPYLAALSGKDRAYKAGWLKSLGAGRESEGFVVCAEQRVVQEGSSPSGARMRSAISERGGNASWAGEGGRVWRSLNGHESESRTRAKADLKPPTCNSPEGRVSIARWNPKGMRRSTGL